MKTLQNTIALGSILFSTSLMANTAWVETALWKAPQVKNFSIKLKGREKLAEECSLYKKAVFKEDGSLTLIAKDPAKLERFRKPFDTLVLTLDVKPYERIEKSIKVEDESQNTNSLPHYVQSEATTGILLGDAEKATFMAGENSYTAVSEMQKLEPSAIVFKQDSTGKYVVVLQGRDTACDLYEGKGQIEMSVPSYVILGDSGYEKLNDFYNKKLLPEISEVILNKTDALVSKASRLGYRTGKVLEEEFQGTSEKETEKQLQQVMKSLFNLKTLDTNPVVIKTSNQVLVNVEDRSEAQPSTISMEF